MPRVAPVPRSRSTMLAVAALTAMLALVLVGVGGGTPVSADTASSMESSLLSWINSARADRGRGPLTATAALTDLAGDRAAKLAAKGVMDHDAAGCLRCQVEALGIDWALYGETLGWTSYAWGSEAAQSLFRAWKGSSFHWDTLMGPAYDVVGIGVARNADGSTYASIVLVDVAGYAPKPTPASTPKPVPTPTPIAVPKVIPAPAPTAVATTEPIEAVVAPTPWRRYGLTPL